MTWRKIKDELAYYGVAVEDALRASAGFSFRRLPVSSPRFWLGIAGSALMAASSLTRPAGYSWFNLNGGVKGSVSLAMFLGGGALWFGAFTWPGLSSLFASLWRRFHRGV